MAMGIVSDHEFYKEKQKVLPPDERDVPIVEDNTIPIAGNIVPDKVNKGRGLGNVQVPNSLRNLLGQTSIEDGRAAALELASHFGISPSSVSAYTHGSKSTASYDEQPNLPTVNKSKDKISKRARMKLMAAMRHITEAKLAECKPGELSQVARNMSAVMSQMETETTSDKSKDKQGPTFVFYSPNAKKEEVYDVVAAKE